MAEPISRPGEAPQQAGGAPAPEVVRVGRDDPAPSPQQEAEDTPESHKPPPRRDNQGEAITGAPTV
jgi:hypothetical protein